MALPDSSAASTLPRDWVAVSGASLPRGVPNQPARSGFLATYFFLPLPLRASRGAAPGFPFPPREGEAFCSAARPDALAGPDRCGPSEGPACLAGSYQKAHCCVCRPGHVDFGRRCSSPPRRTIRNLTAWPCQCFLRTARGEARSSAFRSLRNSLRLRPGPASALRSSLLNDLNEAFFGLPFTNLTHQCPLRQGYRRES